MPRFYPLPVHEIERLTEDSVAISLDVPEEFKDHFQFTQGQYLTFKMNMDGEEIRRSYSICAGIHDPYLRVGVKRVPGGTFSTYANDELEKGDVLETMPPMGNFFTVLDPDQKKHYVAFAAGSGITPVLSIIKTTLIEEPASRFTLFFGNRNISSIMFLNELEGLKNKYIDRFRLYHVLSRQGAENPLFSGRITEDKCKQFFEYLLRPEDVDEVFLCGPYEMTEALIEQLQELGIPHQHIHTELFTPPGEEIQQKQKRKKPDHIPEEATEVKVKVDGKTITFPLRYEGQPILDAAIEQGMDLPYSCKSGVCSTCRARLVKGEVDMEQNYALEEDELDKGFILTCQSHPLSEFVYVDFDQQ